MTATEPPKGGDQNAGNTLIVVVTVFFIPAFLAVFLRMYVRSRIVRSIGWDDWIMLPAITSAFIASAAQIVAAKRGLGRHGFYLSPIEKAQALKYGDLGECFCISALSIGKISICISLLRIISGSDKKYLRLFLRLIILFNFAVNVSLCTVEYSQCRPARKVWDSTVSGECWSPNVYLHVRYLQAALSGATDFILAGLPIYILKDLQLNRRNKISLCVLMGFGSITGILAIVRCVSLTPWTKENDPTWTTLTALIWGGVERNVAIFIACIPFLRPLLQTPFMKSVLSFTTSRSYKRSGYAMHSDQSYDLSNRVNGISTRNSAGGVKVAESNVFPV